MSTGIILGSSPRDHGHHRMMIQVQECDLSIFLTNHKENGIEQLRNFRQEIKVNATSFLKPQARRKNLQLKMFVVQDQGL